MGQSEPWQQGCSKHASQVSISSKIIALPPSWAAWAQKKKAPEPALDPAKQLQPHY